MSTWSLRGRPRLLHRRRKSKDGSLEWDAVRREKRLLLEVSEVREATLYQHAAFVGHRVADARAGEGGSQLLT